ncbi:MAG: DNA polymerase III subunit beta [Omnitrophica WOR_2 bacterium RIFCSPLOWO2_02_FULL_50_19]|nr:MAG: DNA polymerase III subunit beta [Omnitrophica WOR_2 bacterium RIFCSPLOWO2_02_FULL_50_19]
MEFKLTRETLQKGIQTVQNAISQKSGLPILSNILFETSKDKLKLIATDLEIGVISKITGVDVQEDGSISIPAKKISDIVRELPNKEIHLSAKKNNQVTIKCDKSIFKIMGLPKDEFPRVPELSDKETLTIPQRQLKLMLNSTSFAISKDETRYILNGVLLVLTDKKLRIVATDGRRLAMVEKEAPKSLGFTKKVIVPAKAAAELQRILKDDGDAKILFSENQIAFDLDDSQLITRLIEGEYPNYEQVIPKQSQGRLKANRENFYAAVKRASLLATPDSQSIKLDLLKNRVIISKASQDGSESREEVDCEYAGDELTIGFNPNYLMDVLKNISQEEVDFEFAGQDRRGVVRAEGGDYIYIILPVRTE